MNIDTASRPDKPAARALTQALNPGLPATIQRLDQRSEEFSPCALREALVLAPEAKRRGDFWPELDPVAILPLRSVTVSVALMLTCVAVAHGIE